MCPACISVAAWLVLGSSSAGGVLAGIAVKLGGGAANETRPVCKAAPDPSNEHRPSAESP